MFDTLMAEVASLNSLGPMLEKVNFEELELEPQSELQNVQDAVRKYESEIKSLTKTIDELKTFALESDEKQREAHKAMRDLQDEIKASCS